MDSSVLLRFPSLFLIYAYYVPSSSPFSFGTHNSIIPVLYDSSNDLHRDLRYHPEQPARIDACVNALSAEPGAPIANIVDIALEAPADATVAATVGHISCDPLSSSDLERARSLLVQVHSEKYVSQLEERCRKARQRRIGEGKNPLGFVGYVDDETYLTTESYDVCLRATAAWVRGINLLFDLGSGCRTAFALTRPPGHHATAAFANGFCLFNFAAAAANHALSSGYARRVSILDWDVHYGQGVADIIRSKNWGEDCRYVSMHQVPAFPYEGEQRRKTGKFQNVLTVPIQCESTWTCGYKDAFINHALPFVRDEQGEWEPDLIIVSAGYDGLDSDELASTSLTAADYGTMARLLRERVGPDTKILIGLEGGYQLKEGAAGGNLADAVVETVRALAE
uniref:Histone deacetylase domain-containing protein n=1 Tax=Odontella aurita TaxID=265563 RepID=A0A7S4JSA4_9STRA|mmetsp:Transcript_52784/g.158017  ORF Transcript_52784/g.158017 Transcript_52784/m.158017 type:complete len:396 (+) Transcript_52784:211-1398(+)